MKTNTPDRLSGRDHHLISRALYVAARALRAQEHPPHSDIRGMDDLLDRYYAGYNEMYMWQTNLQLAMRLGLQYQPGVTRKEHVERWIAEHLPNDQSVVELHERGAEHDGSEH